MKAEVSLFLVTPEQEGLESSDLRQVGLVKR